MTSNPSTLDTTFSSRLSTTPQNSQSLISPLLLSPTLSPFTLCLCLRTNLLTHRGLVDSENWPTKVHQLLNRGPSDNHQSPPYRSTSDKVTTVLLDQTELPSFFFQDTVKMLLKDSCVSYEGLGRYLWTKIKLKLVESISVSQVRRTFPVSNYRDLDGNVLILWVSLDCIKWIRTKTKGSTRTRKDPHPVSLNLRLNQRPNWIFVPTILRERFWLEEKRILGFWCIHSDCLPVFLSGYPPRT